MAKKTATSEAQEHAGGGKPITKAEAIRQAVAAGMDSPAKGVGFIKAQFGIDISPTHFSAGKSINKKAAGLKAKTTPKPSTSSTPSPKIVSIEEGDLLEVMEAMKPLVALLGVEKVKRLAELLG